MLLQVILCHPQPGSFNHAVAEQTVQALTKAGHGICFHDLYREGFDPILSGQEIRRRFSFDEQVQVYTEELAAADGLIIIHPDWWSQPPAVLKGWVDRVFRPGVVYEFEGEEFMKKQKVPLLSGKKGVVFCTTHSQEEEHAKLLENLWVEGIFRYCGMDEAACYVLQDLYHISHTQRIEWLFFVEETLKSWFPPQPVEAAKASRP